MNEIEDDIAKIYERMVEVRKKVNYAEHHSKYWTQKSKYSMLKAHIVNLGESFGYESIPNGKIIGSSNNEKIDCFWSGEEISYGFDISIGMPSKKDVLKLSKSNSDVKVLIVGYEKRKLYRLRDRIEKLILNYDKLDLSGNWYVIAPNMKKYGKLVDVVEW